MRFIGLISMRDQQQNIRDDFLLDTVKLNEMLCGLRYIVIQWPII